MSVQLLLNLLLWIIQFTESNQKVGEGIALNISFERKPIASKFF